LPLPLNEIAGAYDRWSHTYDVDQNATRDLAASLLRERLPDLAMREVLEIGCGTGLNTCHLAASSRHVLAIDFSEGMLAKARSHVSATNVHFKQQDLRLAWGLTNETVDVIVCMLVLEHIEDLNDIFAEASRVLRRGGEFFICELHPYRQLKGVQARFTEKGSDRLTLVPAYLHDVSDFVNAGLRHGFSLQWMSEPRDVENESDVAIKIGPPRLLALHLRADK
jgi:malonyl-CoA O-methyltransferase